MAAAAAHSVRVLRELNRQRVAGQFCDATLGVGGREFRAHWPVLASCSRFFRAREPGGPVALPEGLADTFQLLLDFFYTGRLALTAHNRARLLAAAEELGVPDAVALCRAFRPAGPRQRPRRPATSVPSRLGEADSAAVAAPQPSGPAATPPAPEEAVGDGGAGHSGAEPLSETKALRSKQSPPPGKAPGGTGAAGSRKGTAAPVECPTCHKTFLSKYYLKVHNRKENLLEHEARNCVSRAEQVFSCSVCQEAFKRRVELRLHMVSHTGEMPYKCSSCAQQFMQKKDLQSHMIKLHGAPKPHACSTCSKCFLSRTELRLHEAFKHRGEKLFVCEECGHRASSRNGLQMHIKAKHRNERPYICEFCHHAFTQKANLNMHLRTHTGEKPFQCHLCGKTFRTQASLDKHNRTHTGERPFGCEFCEQRFTEKGPLLRHVASRHQEGRPHFCQICGKTFKAVEQLRVHVRRHKGVRKFECSECGYKFTRQAHLRRHMEIHDRVENYNPRQRKLRNLVIEDEKAVVVALQPPELEVGSAEVIVQSLSHGPLPEEMPAGRLSPVDVIEQALILTTLPEHCGT
ncbi:telomere zinc finger-associated protein isoform X2 [Melanerpes formicivorus]|uniref:telomere zinc finger-associated protein isoform X2 n=1 Tax=Melanerpes formicivorus TaxID=211600 RepID=UPI00358F7798